MRTAAAALLLLAAAPWALSQPAREYFHDPPPEKWGTPARIVQPEYPPKALEQRITGYVDFEGVVTDVGRVREVTFRPGSPEAEVFVPILRETVPHWVFYPAVGADCMPHEERFTTRVWFELDGDRPSIKVTRAIKEKVVPAAPMKILKRVDPTYPREMMRQRRSGHVYARVDVAPSGDVVAVAARAYPDDSRDKPFARNVENAMQGWKYSPSEAAAPRTACMDIRFVIPE